MIERREFLISTSASLGAITVGVPSARALAIQDTLTRRSYRRFGQRWLRIPASIERPGDRVHFVHARAGEPPRVFATFVIEHAPRGHEAEHVLTPENP